MTQVTNWIEQLRERQRTGTSHRVTLRTPTQNDRQEFLDLMRHSEQLHRPWIFPPLNDAAYHEYLRRITQNDHEGFLVCDRDNRIVGVINLNTIVRGAFLSATLGYYVGAPFAGQGLMHEGLLLVAQHAFAALRLHRIEANIQPANERSKALVRACGFRLEGLSPAFLYIDGAWRDHERWTLIDPRASLY